MKNYYFITYVTKRLGKEFFDCTVIDEHPFGWLKKSKSETSFKVVLVGWQKITEEEYNMFNSEEIESDLDQVEASPASSFELINQDPSEGLES